MALALFIIRGQPGRWEGVAVDTGVAVSGPSFEQVQRCLADVLTPPAPPADALRDMRSLIVHIDARLQRAGRLARHFGAIALGRLGRRFQARESHLIRGPLGSASSPAAAPGS